MDKANKECGNCGHNNHWYEVETKHGKGTGELDILSFVECPKCKGRTKSYLDPDKAAKDWNNGILTAIRLN